MSQGLINSALFNWVSVCHLHCRACLSNDFGRSPSGCNLYSSAVLWGGAQFLGWILERIYRNAIGSSVAALVGFSTLIIANHLAKKGTHGNDAGSTRYQLLVGNPYGGDHHWLFGYFSRGFLAIIYVLRGVFTIFG